jgi:hypothetical protein
MVRLTSPSLWELRELVLGFLVVAVAVGLASGAVAV